MAKKADPKIEAKQKVKNLRESFKDTRSKDEPNPREKPKGVRTVDESKARANDPKGYDEKAGKNAYEASRKPAGEVKVQKYDSENPSRKIGRTVDGKPATKEQADARLSETEAKAKARARLDGIKTRIGEGARSLGRGVGAAALGATALGAGYLAGNKIQQWSDNYQTEARSREWQRKQNEHEAARRDRVAKEDAAAGNGIDSPDFHAESYRKGIEAGYRHATVARLAKETSGQDSEPAKPAQSQDDSPSKFKEPASATKDLKSTMDKSANKVKTGGRSTKDLNSKSTMSDEEIIAWNRKRGNVPNEGYKPSQADPTKATGASALFNVKRNEDY